MFATAGPNTRTTQLFINFADNSRLDGMGFAPFGNVVDGMDVVDKIYPGYRESPRQDQITEPGRRLPEGQFPQDRQDQAGSDCSPAAPATGAKPAAKPAAAKPTAKPAQP